MNASGVITDRSDWKTTSDALQLGWESTFGDINGDGIIGQPTKPITDADGDGFVDGVDTFQIFNNGSAINLTDHLGTTFYEHFSPHWDAIKAVSSGSDYKVLLKGKVLLNGEYGVWDVNASGVITEESWKTTSDAIRLGWETTFGDINGDGIIGQPIV